MFDNNSKNGHADQKREISGQEAAAGGGVLVLVLGGLWHENNKQAVTKLWFEYYEWVYMAGFGLIALLLVALAYFIRSKTKKLDEREEHIKPMSEARHDSIIIGETMDKVPLFLSNKDRCSHVQIVGSTGRGKTESVIFPWAARDIKRGHSVIVIDGKGSKDLPERLFYVGMNTGVGIGHRPLHFDLGNPERSSKINPLRGGNAQQITDRLFASLTFEEPFYKTVQKDICENLAKLILSQDLEVNFKRLYELLTDEETLAKQLSESKDEILKRKLTSFLKESRKERQKKMYGLISQLSPFAQGELSEIVNGDQYSWNANSVQLTDLVKTGKYQQWENDEPRPFVLVISIPALTYQEIGHQFGKLIMQNIAYAVGERENNEENEFLPVFLDEFSEFVYPKFISVLNKARSTGVSFHLSHQSQGDLDQVDSSFAKSVMTNTNVKCILGLNDPDTADFFARHIGTIEQEKLTEQADGTIWGEPQKTGMLSVRKVEAFKISPNDLKDLNNGRGVIHLPSKKSAISEEMQFQSFQDYEMPQEVF